MKYFILALLVCSYAVAELDLVVCPDKVSACPDGTTCCKLGSGFGCCPIEFAVCCQDERHCCPHSMTCDTAEGRCIQESTGKHYPLHKKVPAYRLEDDGSSENQGLPIVWEPNAEMDEDAMRLEYPRENASPRREPFRSRVQKDVDCADGKSKCPSGTTCCKVGSDSYGCCPIPHAVCCSDHLHCCLEGTRCDVAEGRCIQEDGSAIPWYRKFSATKVVRKPGIKLTSSIRPCNGGTCKGEETCCQSSGMIPECCPFENGVCCSNGRCCPSGYKCHRDGCVAHTEGVTVTAPLAILRRGSYTFDIAEDEEDYVTCPDNSQCPAGNTCCPQPKDSGTTTYQCCNLSVSNCCSGGTICCPRGFHCVGGTHCERTSFSQELLKHIHN